MKSGVNAPLIACSTRSPARALQKNALTGAFHA
jgi:hypothetical protein